MIPFRREGDLLVTEVGEAEVALLTSLVSQVNELLGGAGEPAASADPFAAWESEFEAGVALDRSDPVVARLFPDAYDDAASAAEHHRYSQESLRRGRLAEAATVLSALESVGDGGGRLALRREDVDAWLRTVNGVRLALAVRLGIEDESDHADLQRVSARDPRAGLVDLYDWLGYVLESLIEAAFG